MMDSMDALQAAVNQLPLRDRYLLSLRHIWGMSARQIAVEYARQCAEVGDPACGEGGETEWLSSVGDGLQEQLGLIRLKLRHLGADLPVLDAEWGYLDLVRPGELPTGK